MNASDSNTSCSSTASTNKQNLLIEWEKKLEKKSSRKIGIDLIQAAEWLQWTKPSMTKAILYSLIYGWPITWRNMAISCRVASNICDGDESLLSAPKSIILAANSRPVSFSTHRRTVELIPLKMKKKKRNFLISKCNQFAWSIFLLSVQWINSFRRIADNTRVQVMKEGKKALIMKHESSFGTKKNACIDNVPLTGYCRKWGGRGERGKLRLKTDHVATDNEFRFTSWLDSQCSRFIHTKNELWHIDEHCAIFILIQFNLSPRSNPLCLCQNRLKSMATQDFEKEKKN